MPFTLAHPAAVLPIHSRWKRWLALAPLAVGSMVPDAAYYLPMPDNFKGNAHTVLGAFTFSLPAGIFILLLFYWMAPGIVFLLPSPHREALGREIEPYHFSIEAVLTAFCGIVIGAETHVVWDAFTHEDGWVVERVAFLRNPIWRVHPFLFLQVLSSLFGLAVLFYVYDRWAMSRGFRAWTIKQVSWRSLLWPGMVTLCLVLALLESHTLRGIENYPRTGSRHFVVLFMISFVRDFIAGICAVAAGVKIFSGRSRLDVAY